MLKVELSVNLLNEGGSTMKKTKLRDSQIISMLNEAESGVPIADICRKYKVANSTYYKLKAKYAGKTIFRSKYYEEKKDKAKKDKKGKRDKSSTERFNKKDKR